MSPRLRRARAGVASALVIAAALAGYALISTAAQAAPAHPSQLRPAICRFSCE